MSNWASLGARQYPLAYKKYWSTFSLFQSCGVFVMTSRSVERLSPRSPLSTGTATVLPHSYLIESWMWTGDDGRTHQPYSPRASLFQGPSKNHIFGLCSLTSYAWTHGLWKGMTEKTSEGGAYIYFEVVRPLVQHLGILAGSPLYPMTSIRQALHPPSIAIYPLGPNEGPTKSRAPQYG